MKLKTKLMSYYLIATLLALILVGFAVFKSIENLSITTMEKQLIAQSKLSEIYISQMHSIEDPDSKELTPETSQSVISKLGLVIGNIHIYDKNLRLQASSKSTAESSIKDSQNNKILSAALGGNYAYTIKGNTAYFASPINIGDDIIGILQIIYPMSFLENLINDVIKILISGAAIFIILVAILIAYIAGKITKPINKLAAAANNYANRNFTPVRIKGSDEIAQLSKSFSDMGIQLQDYIERQKIFVSNVSHELRTPLTAIKGYSEYLKDEVEDRPDLQKAVYHLNNESERLTRLVEEVLTLSRIDSSLEKLNLESLNFSKLVNDTIGKMLLKAQKYGIKIVSSLEPEIYIQGDKEKLIQVIMNLLDNAIKFSPYNSKVEIKLWRDFTKVYLAIKDYGIGIPKEAKEKLFERFYRANNAQGISGTGLGLSIVKYIVNAHGGIIELEGHEVGTTAKLTLLPNKDLLQL